MSPQHSQATPRTRLSISRQRRGSLWDRARKREGRCRRCQTQSHHCQNRRGCFVASVGICCSSGSIACRYLLLPEASPRIVRCTGQDSCLQRNRLVVCLHPLARSLSSLLIHWAPDAAVSSVFGCQRRRAPPSLSRCCIRPHCGLMIGRRTLRSLVQEVA